MNILIFNIGLLLGWLMVLAGGVMLHLAGGIAAAGVLLLVLVFLSVRLAGGLYAAPPKSEGS